MRVSVVIPAYNRARRLPQAIDSVLAQGVAGLEVIVVDDGSTDDTRSVVEAYGDRVRYTYQSNAGVGAARNTGMRQATGEFVAFLDSDDRWHAFKLSAQLALLDQRPDVGLVFSDFVIEKSEGAFQENGASLWAGRALDFPEMQRLVLERPRTGAGRQWPADTIACWSGPMYRQLLTELPILTSSVVVRRSVLDATIRYAEGVVLFEDWEFFARVARRSHVGYLAVPTTINVGHTDPGRVSKCSSLDRAESYRRLLERVWLADAAFVKQWPDEVRAAYHRALLAVAREALLAGARAQALAALASRKDAGFTDRRGWAATYAVCARLAGGPALLRNILRGQTAFRLASGSGRAINGSVNPAA